MSDISRFSYYIPFASYPEEICPASLLFEDTLGKGSFGWVIAARYRGRRVVVQSLREEASPSDQQHFVNHVLARQRMNGHENVSGLICATVLGCPMMAVFEQNLCDLHSFLKRQPGSFSFNHSPWKVLKM